jgi:quercetin dioxygenase-like cupin family protein
MWSRKPSLKIINYEDIKPEPEMHSAKGVSVRWLITKKMGAPNFAMRLFEVDQNGSSPNHEHPWEHEVFILDGEGEVENSEGKHAIKSGDVILISSNETHQIINTGSETLRFLCIIPHIDDQRMMKKN